MLRVAAVLLAFPAIAVADDAALKKLMPKDQLAFVERIEALAKLKDDADAEKNGLKKKEMEEKLVADSWSLRREIETTISEKGVSEWVGVCQKQTSSVMYVSYPRLLDVLIVFDGLRQEAKESIKMVKDGDRVSFTIDATNRPISKPEPKRKFPATLPFQFNIHGSKVKSASRVPVSK